MTATAAQHITTSSIHVKIKKKEKNKPPLLSICIILVMYVQSLVGSMGKHENKKEKHHFFFWFYPLLPANMLHAIRINIITEISI